MVVDYTKRKKPKQTNNLKRDMPQTSSRTKSTSRSVKSHSDRSEDHPDIVENDDGPFDYSPNFFTQFRPAMVVFVVYIFYIGRINGELKFLDFVAGVLIMCWFGHALRATVKRVKATLVRGFDQIDDRVEELYEAGDEQGAIEEFMRQTDMSRNMATKFLPMYLRSKKTHRR